MTTPNTSEATTRAIRVAVSSEYHAQQSRPAAGQWFFAYHVTITNEGDETVQLLGRHWIITDADGDVQEVRGPGVVGEQPVLRPGESHRYTSGCPLGTPVGTMHGTYRMVNQGGEQFDIEIAPFALSEPYAFN